MTRADGRLAGKKALVTGGSRGVLVSNAGQEHFGSLESIIVADYE